MLTTQTKATTKRQGKSTTVNLALLVDRIFKVREGKKALALEDEALSKQIKEAMQEQGLKEYLTNLLVAKRIEMPGSERLDQNKVRQYLSPQQLRAATIRGEPYDKLTVDLRKDKVAEALS